MSPITAVTAASDSFRLTTAAAVRTALNISDVSEEAFLNSVIDRQSAAAANLCQRIFPKQSYTDTFRGVECEGFLSLSNWPVTAIASVTVDGTALDSDEYEHDGKSWFLYRLSDDERIDWSGSKIVVAYTAGYVLPAQTLIGATPITPATDRTLPHDIEAAVIDAVSMAYNGRDRDPLLRSEEFSGVGSESYTVTATSDGAMPPSVAARLAPYRKLLIG